MKRIRDLPVAGRDDGCWSAAPPPTSSTSSRASPATCRSRWRSSIVATLIDPLPDDRLGDPADQVAADELPQPQRRLRPAGADLPGRPAARGCSTTAARGRSSRRCRSCSSRSPSASPPTTPSSCSRGSRRRATTAPRTPSAVAIGLERTGRIVTAAALLFAVAMRRLRDLADHLHQGERGRHRAGRPDRRQHHPRPAGPLADGAARQVELVGAGAAAPPARAVRDQRVRAWRAGAGEGLGVMFDANRGRMRESPCTHSTSTRQCEDLGDGRFAAEMSERWWVERGPNGGYVAAVVLRAIQAAAAIKRAPRSLTVQFPRAPRRRAGGDHGEDGARGPHRHLPLGADGAAGQAAGDGPGGARRRPRRERLRGAANARASSLRRSCTPPTPNGSPACRRCSRTTACARPWAMRPSPAAPPTAALWIRAREPRLLDAPLAAAILDAWFPAPFIRLERPVPAPTIDYTVHFRAPSARPRRLGRGSLPGYLPLGPGPRWLLRGRRRALEPGRELAGTVASAGASSALKTVAVEGGQRRFGGVAERGLTSNSSSMLSSSEKWL